VLEGGEGAKLGETLVRGTTKGLIRMEFFFPIRMEWTEAMFC
jgi:hypothetical protein